MNRFISVDRPPYYPKIDAIEYAFVRWRRIFKTGEEEMGHVDDTKRIV